MRQVIILFAFVILFGASCSDNESDSEFCVYGNVLTYDCCVGISLIDIRGHFPIGRKYTFQDHTYANVIQVPGNYYGSGDHYFRLRKYIQETDHPNGECLCIISVPYNLPWYTATASSESGCP